MITYYVRAATVREFPAKTPRHYYPVVCYYSKTSLRGRSVDIWRGDPLPSRGDAEQQAIQFAKENPTPSEEMNLLQPGLGREDIHWGWHGTVRGLLPIRAKKETWVPKFGQQIWVGDSIHKRSGIYNAGWRVTTWIPRTPSFNSPPPPRPAMYIGRRMLAEGGVEAVDEDQNAFDPYRFFWAWLVVENERKNPYFVLPENAWEEEPK